MAGTRGSQWFLLITWLLLLPLQAAAAPFQYSAEDTPLADFLCAFATQQNKACVTSEGIQGTVSGEFTFASPKDFLAFAKRSKDVTAYTDESTIYFGTRAEMQSEVIPLGQVGVSGLTAALRQMGAYDSQFPLRSGYDGMMAMITAPPVYVEVIRSVADTLLQMAPPVPRATRVFRLKHAFAEDIQVNVGQTTKTIPGVASLLRRLVGTQDIENANTSAQSTRTGQVNRRMGQGLSRNTGTQGAIPTQQDLAAEKSGAAAGAASGVAAGAPTANTGARILADPRLNAVVVWDEEHLMPFYETIVRELDEAVMLVEIRAAIADVSVTSLQELGFSYALLTGKPGIGNVGAIGGINLDSALNNLSSGTNIATIFTGGLDRLMASIHMLESDGNANVLSRPTVLTSDNAEAVLENTNTFYVKVEGYQSVDLFDVTYGTVLRVTPQIVNQANGKKLIKLVVNIEDGVSTPPSRNSGLSLPDVGKTTISTQAMVGDSQALVIGGYYYETKKVTADGIPVLMSIPVLGSLFKNNQDAVNKKERLFIISPRIIDPQNIPDMPPAVAESFDRTMFPMRPMPESGGCTRRPSMTPEARMPTPVSASAPSVSNVPGHNRQTALPPAGSQTGGVASPGGSGRGTPVGP